MHGREGRGEWEERGQGEERGEPFVHVEMMK